MNIQTDKIYAEVEQYTEGYGYAVCRDVKKGIVIYIDLSSKRRVSKLKKLWADCTDFSSYWKAAIEVTPDITYKAQ